MAFVWDVLRRLCDAIDRPLILFIHDVEHTLCSSFERYDAFEDAFGQRSQPAHSLPHERASMKLPLVVVGGCALGESGTHITPATRSGAFIAECWLRCFATCHTAPICSQPSRHQKVALPGLNIPASFLSAVFG